jgi:transcription elongation factor GreB
MSKAFTKEDDDAVVDDPLPPRALEPQPITSRGLRELRAEHEALIAAGAQGTRRARLVARILETVVEQRPASEPTRAQLGCAVTVEHDDGRRSTWELVGPDEAAPDRGRISVTSPVGRALRGQALGDVVTLRRPRGDENVTVVDIAVLA